MKTIVLGPGIYQIVDSRVYSPGDVIEVEDQWAQRLISLGHAKVFDPEAKLPEPKMRATSKRAANRKTRVKESNA